jgi:DNA repair exonuclease SbcCD ATPase subunit
MHRSSFFLLGFLLISTAAFGQTSSTDSQTLQALLAEVRQLRQDLQNITVAAQRAQILVYRLQLQQAAVARASQRLDDARSKLEAAQANRKKVAAEIKKYEEMLRETPRIRANRKGLKSGSPEGRQISKLP